MKEELSKREHQVMLSLIHHGGIQAVAEKLHLSPNTVSTHMSRVRAKFKLTAKGSVMGIQVVVAYIRRYGMPDPLDTQETKY